MADNNNVLVEKAKAKELIQDSARKYLTAKITLPLGNPNLKKVHTNQFLWTELPDEFALKNWGVIAEVLGSSFTRYSGYTVNRWYIEENNITVEIGGKAEMQLSLNAFPSETSDYGKNYQGFIKAYTDATNQTSNTTNNSSTKTTTNAVTTKTVLNQEWIKKYKIPSALTKIIQSICGVNQSDYDKVRTWFNWMDREINYNYYTNHKRSIEQVLKVKGGNCVDNSIVFVYGCRAMGIKANFIMNPCISHQYSKVYIGNKSYIVDVGRQQASWGSHWGGGGCPSEVENNRW